jgi:apolipoprotein N-acyltransferase
VPLGSHPSYTRAMQAASIPDSLRTRFALAVGSGMLYAASLPPLGAWPVAWIALAPVWLACVGVRPRVAFALGLGFGLTAAALTSPWLPAMIGDYFDQPGVLVWPLSVVGWVLCGAVYLAIACSWLAWAVRYGPVYPFVVGAAWWVTEWARANAFVGNPWALLGYSQIGFLPAAQSADVWGAYGLGALLAATSAAVAGLVLPARFGSRGGRSAIATFVIAALVIVYGLVRLAQEPEPNETTLIALVQAALPRIAQPDPIAVAAHLERQLSLTKQVAAHGVDLVLWPELALDFYVEHEPALRRRLVEALAGLDIELITGGFGTDPERGLPTNSLFVVSGDGLLSRYDKVRPMVFSEANPLPFDEAWPDAIAAGKSTLPLQHRGMALGVAICSEAMHAEHVREVVRGGAEVLLSPSIDRWFGSLGGKRQQLEAVAMRAIETRRFVLRPTASGISAIIDPFGRVLAQAPIDEPATLVASFSPQRVLTPYVRFGDTGVAIACVLLALDAARRIRRGPSTGPPGWGDGDQAATAAAATERSAKSRSG